MNRDEFETRALRHLRRLVIAFFLLLTAFPFYYMLVLSVRPIERVLLDPGALLVTGRELTFATYAEVLKAVEDGGQGFLTFMGNSALVSTGAAVIALVVSVPGAYAVSRLRFFGRRQVDFLFLAVYL
ncbi:MAG TPA: carbohydrate ABC transporter permease, partial [Micromonospora sp.]